MRESTVLGSTLLAGAATGLFGWDLTRPETLAHVNTARSTHFLPRRLGEEERSEAWRGWLRAVDRSRGWIETLEDWADDRVELSFLLKCGRPPPALCLDKQITFLNGPGPGPSFQRSTRRSGFYSNCYE